VYDPTKPYKERLSPKNDGIHVTWYGNTTDTLDKSDCGLKSVGQIMPYSILNSKGTSGYSILIKQLKKMGF